MNTRKELIESGNTLSLAVEGRFTNLEIWIRNWTCKKKKKYNGVYMRLDHFNQYSTSLTPDILHYLEKDNEVLTKLATFGFPAPIEQLDEILELTSKMCVRECKPW